ncbi:MAG: OpgC family protein [Rhodopila sp.]
MRRTISRAMADEIAADGPVVAATQRDVISRFGEASVRKRQRDLRLDFFRGLALIFIFIDHIPDNVVSWFTLHVVAFCDAAEMFIFISGYTAALAYAPVFVREGVAMGFARVYRRVWQLYVAHIFLFMIFSAEVAYTLKVRYNPLFAEELAVGDYLSAQGEAFIRVLLLQFQPNLLNILPLYIALLLGLPFLILVMRRHLLLGLAPSAVLWLLAILLHWNLPGFPEGRLWYFNPLAWQFLFTIGVAMGLHGAEIPWPRWLPTAALIFAAGAGLMAADWTLHSAYPHVPNLFQLPESWFDKTSLPPLRILSILALAVLVADRVPRDARWFSSRIGWPVMVCGQHSLEVFCLTIILAVLANFVLGLMDYSLPMQLLVNAAGVLVMIGFALLLSWFRSGGQWPHRPAAASA